MHGRWLSAASTCLGVGWHLVLAVTAHSTLHTDSQHSCLTPPSPTQAQQGRQPPTHKKAHRNAPTSASLPSTTTRCGTVWEKACSCCSAGAPLLAASADATTTTRRAAEWAVRRLRCTQRAAGAPAAPAAAVAACGRWTAARARGTHAVGAAVRLCMVARGPVLLSSGSERDAAGDKLAGGGWASYCVRDGIYTAMCDNAFGDGGEGRDCTAPCCDTVLRCVGSKTLLQRQKAYPCCLSHHCTAIRQCSAAHPCQLCLPTPPARSARVPGWVLLSRSVIPLINPINCSGPCCWPPLSPGLGDQS